MDNHLGTKVWSKWLLMMHSSWAKTLTVFDSKRAQLFDIFEYLPSPISYLFNRFHSIQNEKNTIRTALQNINIIFRHSYKLQYIFNLKFWQWWIDKQSTSVGYFGLIPVAITMLSVNKISYKYNTAIWIRDLRISRLRSNQISNRIGR